MSLSPRARLGPYEILSAIGAGGMGEVYCATDTNLKRAVAIKVLPASVASDPERLARFQREAEVFASLSDPNIAAIYFLNPSEAMIAAPIAVTGVTLEPGAPVVLFPTPTRSEGGGVDTAGVREYDVASDGRFLDRHGAGAARRADQRSSRI
jgi:hypothetical protein